VLDAWGTAIRYVPTQGSGSTFRRGYFLSAGPDGRFYASLLGCPEKNDDVLSTDPQ
jgi:hypothetical protein